MERLWINPNNDHFYMEVFTNHSTSLIPAAELDKAVQVLRNDGLILFPTDTLWAVGCDATNVVALHRLFKLKGRPHDKPVILLVDSVDMLRRYVDHLHPRVETLLYYHSRPLTVVYPDGRQLPPLALAPDGSVAIRIPKDEFCRRLIGLLGRPVVASSAHIGRMARPTHFGEISSLLIEGVDQVVKHRQKERTFGEPSVIARLSDKEELEFLRE
ncbi:MAG: L-threonylcarbamoyladenylate synthase [Saprospiraceae bacterium]|nr:L-threonylcarbamoyladenylate synthase [Saprospiraceae bacterium]